MGIDPPDAASEKAMVFQEAKHFLMVCRRQPRETFEHCQDLMPPGHGAACEFANDERVAFHFPGNQQRGKPLVAAAQMVDPDRSVDEH